MTQTLMRAGAARLTGLSFILTVRSWNAASWSLDAHALDPYPMVSNVIADIKFVFIFREICMYSFYNNVKYIINF